MAAPAPPAVGTGGQRQIAWMERTGRVARVDEDPFQDQLIQAYESQQRPAPDRLRDFNPWGNDVRI